MLNYDSEQFDAFLDSYSLTASNVVESGASVLYTETLIARHRHAMRGALMSALQPVRLADVCSSLNAAGLALQQSLAFALVDEMVGSGQLLGVPIEPILFI